MYRITRRIEVAGAHKLTLPYDSPCGVLHGHNWIITVTMQGVLLNDAGMLVDFKHIKNIVHQLDHQNINEVLQKQNEGQEVNPTAENIAKWVATQLDDYCIAAQSEAYVTEVCVQESEGNKAWYIP